MSYESNVRRAADRLGIDLDDTAATDYAEVAEGMAAQFAALDASVPDHPGAGDVEDGDDEYDALRHRFDLPTGDGPLDGLSLGVKDNVAVSGVPMHCGSAALSFEPGYHATVVSRLLDAGADVTATTNMDEFAYFTTGETCAFGPAKNPRVEGCVPGGSSSGSAAAVAASIVDAALGSDTGGSVRIPSSFCGVVGLKPTHGAVPRFGFADLAPSLDGVGPIAPDVETTARVYDVIAGPDDRDPSSLGSPGGTDAADGIDAPVEDRRIGVVEPAMADADDEVRTTVDAAVDALEAEGATADTVALPGYRTASLAALVVAASEFAAVGATQGHVLGTGTGYSEPWREAISAAFQSPDLGENVREQLLTAGALNDAGVGHYVVAQEFGAELRGILRGLFEDYDALVTPTTPMTAPGFGEIETAEEFARTVANTAPFNLTGHPALSVPGGTVDGAPVGVQFVGPYGDERGLVALGSALSDSVGPA